MKNANWLPFVTLPLDISYQQGMWVVNDVYCVTCGRKVAAPSMAQYLTPFDWAAAMASQQWNVCECGSVLVVQFGRWS